MNDIAFNFTDQQKIKKSALNSTQTLLSKMDLDVLTPLEQNILKDIANKLFVKFYNGRDPKLLTTDYVIAEAVDIALERSTKLLDTLPLRIAIADFARVFQKFIIKEVTA